MLEAARDTFCKRDETRHAHTQLWRVLGGNPTPLLIAEEDSPILFTTHMLSYSTQKDWCTSCCKMNVTVCTSIHPYLRCCHSPGRGSSMPCSPFPALAWRRQFDRSELVRKGPRRSREELSIGKCSSENESSELYCFRNKSRPKWSENGIKIVVPNHMHVP